jgi:GAF domain/PilZ domain
MILDLSEQGLSMQTAAPMDANRRLELRLDLPDSDAPLETTGYIAWADALGRAGVRFSDLPEDARLRLDQWLALHDEAPSRKAPKLTFDQMPAPSRSTSAGREIGKPRSISLEADTGTENLEDPSAGSATIQYEFHSLGSDLNAALRVISERARTLLRGSGAAIALIDRDPLMSARMISGGTISERMPSARITATVMLCRASVGSGGPPLGTHVDINSGFSGECVRIGKALRCDDTATDPRVAAENCRRLRIRSIAAAPIRYEREVVGLVEVFSPDSFAFDEGDLAVLERLAQTAILMVSQAQLHNRA